MNEGVLAHTFSECSVKDDYSKSVASKKMWENISDSTKKGYDSKWDMNITEEPKKKDIGKFTRTFSRKATDDKFTKAPLNEVSIFRKMSRQEELQVSESAKKLLKENNVYNESSVAEAESIYDDSSLPFEFVGNDRNEQKSEIQVAQSWIGESNAAKATCCTRVRIRASAIGRSCGEAREKTLTNTFGLPTSLVLPSSAASTARLTSVLPSRSSLSSSSSLLSPAAMPYSGTCVEHGRVWIGYSAANLADGCCDSADKGATENTKTTSTMQRAASYLTAYQMK
ncbi:uncharacterized protein MONOS_8311c2 [Monocercomonoides exilis]|uniref:uncharacterized protein n=1 Tax=Monocercomonoides exilis TaxID=2049356 RepID=UPI00355A0251|nr:hypothetical protein MONOS_8311c1 [Monocercomonoides exilis]KAH7826230.1 hypothetical protein MONOS_8311c2 [Monocercomonoides exilis]|eukprot:MONOS_8311.1-p1 / transcript=MONOS_8311.1 / gene=MONOS_8311 / organism=Monocercomonoides_exilis_PA203 / gene_product=unspecified product / transcript_product=unspecified product / location=Mono_scaffold00311:78-1143(+) / protein_length=283 / sequence_SO=supercontig / SO=protein_coding / is_pseudo=false